MEILRTHCQWITVERTAYTEQVAVVLATHSHHKLHPLVEVVLNSDRHACLPRALNLNHGPTAADGNTYNIRKALPDGVPGFSLAEHIRHQSDNGAGAGTPKPEPR